MNKAFRWTWSEAQLVLIDHYLNMTRQARCSLLELESFETRGLRGMKGIGM